MKYLITLEIIAIVAVVLSRIFQLKKAKAKKYLFVTDNSMNKKGKETSRSKYYKYLLTYKVHDREYTFDLDTVDDCSIGNSSDCDIIISELTSTANIYFGTDCLYKMEVRNGKIIELPLKFNEDDSVNFLVDNVYFEINRKFDESCIHSNISYE